MKKHKIVLLPFLRYGTPKTMQKFLEDQALAGWYPNISIFNVFFLVLHLNTPKKYQYFFDFRFLRNRKYKALFQEFNWEFVGLFSNIYVWRRISSETVFSPYNENEQAAIIRRFSILYYSVGIPVLLLSVVSAIMLLQHCFQSNWMRAGYFLVQTCFAGFISISIFKNIYRLKHA